jgi:phenylacetic acid degradation operon negative regulatory protein
MRPRAGSSAKALLLTLLGEFVLPAGGSAWTQSLVGSLAALDVGEHNARQAVARLSEQGLIAGERLGRRTRWALTPAGTQLLVEGAGRIYPFGSTDDGWDGRWLMVVYSTPASERAKRQRLRSRLAFAGFGFLGPTVAITPHLDREPLANSVLEDLDAVAGSFVVRAEVGDLVPVEDLVHRAWDLGSLAASYRAFATEFESLEPSRPAVCFAAVVRLVHEWRRFPFIDAEIPSSLLPVEWPGGAAKRLFDDLHAAWSPTATAYYRALEDANA